MSISNFKNNKQCLECKCNTCKLNNKYMCDNCIECYKARFTDFPLKQEECLNYDKNNLL